MVTKDCVCFQGESKHWEVEFEAAIRSESSESTGYTIRYIGDGEPPEEISYQVGSSSGNETLQNEVLKSSGSYCSGCSITVEDQEIDAKIEWDEETENITLKNE
ncbi:phosphoadenosine phosphosulfate sulfotransferase [Virgibacillus sp. L01]|uniref:phosphoadenosine phosphosulfate sulfotransferase n=1 Tax=Virgibacillus sp. L01 TaxID=3457429 RepID=UPI003FD16B36